MKRPSTFGMTIRQLQELFGVGRDLGEPSSVGDAAAKRDLLEQQLARRLPPDRGRGELLPDLVESPGRVSQVRTGGGLGDILRDPSSDLKTVRRVKRYAKDLAADAVSRDEHDVAAAVYYAAIAHALVFQDQRITRFPPVVLAETYARLSAETWMPQELVRLFQQARTRCCSEGASG